jgi:hypothetical protein
MQSVESIISKLTAHATAGKWKFKYSARANLLGVPNVHTCQPPGKAQFLDALALQHIKRSQKASQIF